MYADTLQVQAGHLLVKMFGQAVYIYRILFVEELYLGQSLIGEAVAHHKTGVSRGTTQINQSAIGQKDDAVSVGEEVTVHLRLYVLALDA